MHEVHHQGNIVPQTTVLIGYGELCLLSNQISGFFDHQCLWKESINLLDFLHGDNHQRKVTSGTATFDWVGPVVPLIQSVCRILRSSIFLKEIE